MSDTQPRTVLTHYTTRAGLEGMLRSRQLWATNFLQLDDPSEYFYAWSIVNKAAMRLTMAQVPDDIKKPDFDLDKTAAMATDELRNFGRTSDPYGQLYVFSFAQGKGEDENTRGILTLWKLYAKIDGYCLQYNEADIHRVLSMEATMWSYELLNMVRVRYGVDTNSQEFKKLSWQLSQYYLRDIFQAHGDDRISIEAESWMAESAFFRRLLEFCASHKDPMYKDERELRIFVYPSSRASSRPFTGIARVKPILTSPAGKRYVALGDDIRPSFTPFRIMGANKASDDFGDLLKDYSWPPDFNRVELPISS